MRILLVHWNASEIAERERILVEAGHVVHRLSDTAEIRMRDLDAVAPEVVVIDLRRLPSHGRELAMALLERKASRSIPIVFIEGEEAKTARIREALPGATFTPPAGILGAVRRARPTAAPLRARDDGGGYSGKPLVTKLGIASETTVALLNAPREFATSLEPLPSGVRLVRRVPAAAATIVLFATAADQLRARLPRALGSLANKGALWVAWPKQRSKVATDLSEDAVRAIAAELGLVDVKVCAIDPTWSGLCLRRRVVRAPSAGVAAARPRTRG